MGIAKMVRRIGPFIALAAAAGLAGCDGMDVTINGEEGVPLAELDMSGDAPIGVALGGSDTVNITAGDEFTIEVEGSDAAADRLRFMLEDGTLAIGREEGSWSDSDVATINVTMPAPSMIAIGGSGQITADTMDSNAEIVVGGSGSATVGTLESESLEIVIGGSGSVSAAGSADRLEITIGGNGSAMMPDLRTEWAEINIGGSGNASFASDGTVEANIGGSGNIRVYGTASCELNSIGSGELVCEPADDAPEASIDEAANES
ncbi:head GIN domain-containing protein [Aurantiacibacter marinus]|uniref:Putative auto-transporter adhesin head GIN domain-containing protein n=1 Tax=Aurantiacibacter marinus TaxID=874156 RepID=A0A0H0XRX0_9SPHN|nr:head GIN domain-containing protein [Aurantiacibacter marinus]KLI64756.1 hypothetical protein AAV99_04315 [Aurantiacibacter marinus]